MASLERNQNEEAELSLCIIASVVEGRVCLIANMASPKSSGPHVFWWARYIELNFTHAIESFKCIWIIQAYHKNTDPSSVGLGWGQFCISKLPEAYAAGPQIRFSIELAKLSCLLLSLELPCWYIMFTSFSSAWERLMISQVFCLS